MALTYLSFQSFPLQIVGISSDYNAKITAIENFVISDLAYSGDAEDLTAVLPYFVFWFFCQDAQTTVFSETGENSQVKEFSNPETYKQERAWNIGVEKLRTLFGITDEALSMAAGTMAEKIHALVLGSGKTVNEKYLSKRSLL
jgi:hypothetical protein